MKKIIVVKIIVLFITGCDSSMQPLDKENGIVGVYGMLDLNQAQNFIRIRDLNAPFTEEATRELNFDVTLQNLNTDFLEKLEPKRINFAGVYQYNFEVNQPINPDQSYKLEVLQPDGSVFTKTILSPTYPMPVSEPINQDCYTPIKVGFEPLNGSSIGYRIGFMLSSDTTWSGTQFLVSEDSTTKELSFSFVPVDQLRVVPGSFGRFRCSDLINTNFFVSYSHYSVGFAEDFLINDFDVFKSTQRFGSYYEDDLAIPIDTSRVCPPDCIIREPDDE